MAQQLATLTSIALHSRAGVKGTVKNALLHAIPRETLLSASEIRRAPGIRIVCFLQTSERNTSLTICRGVPPGVKEMGELLSWIRCQHLWKHTSGQGRHRPRRKLASAVATEMLPSAIGRASASEER